MNDGILLTLVENVETLIYELREKNRILLDKCKKLEKRIVELEYKYNNVCNTNNVKYLAIGNSITVHSICDYWWSTCGMAASDIEHDYVHILAKKIGYCNNEVDVFNFYQWELMEHDRSECLPFLEKHMSISIDLCTVQLGENIINSKNLMGDFRELLLYIRHRCPRAVLVVIGNFWEVQECDRIKMKVAKELGVIWIDLMDIKSNKHFMAKLGTTVYGDNMERHIIMHDGVAMHPNDAAMYCIATKIYNSLKQRKEGK